MNLGQRIMIMGSSGSGKSTMARKLGERLSLPVFYMDNLWWLPGWQPRDPDEMYAMHTDIIAQPEWVFDGNYSKAIDERLARADTVIFLDFTRYICVWRVLKRRVMYHGKSRPDMTKGCNETLDWEFIKLVWSYPRKRARKLAWLSEIEPPKQVYHLKGSRAVKKFLAELTE